jgi:hypothetical protein
MATLFFFRFKPDFIFFRVISDGSLVEDWIFLVFMVVKITNYICISKRISKADTIFMYSRACHIRMCLELVMYQGKRHSHS